MLYVLSSELCVCNAERQNVSFINLFRTELGHCLHSAPPVPILLISTTAAAASTFYYLCFLLFGNIVLYGLILKTEKNKLQPEKK